MVRRMAVDVTTGIVIERPRQVVAVYAADPDNATAWYSNIKKVEWKSEPQLAEGARVAFTATFLGRELAYTYEIIDHRPGEKLVMKTAQGPFPMETTYTWQDAPGNATRMQLRNRGNPSGFSALAAPLLAAQMRKANEADLRALKRILESSQAE